MRKRYLPLREQRVTGRWRCELWRASFVTWMQVLFRRSMVAVIWQEAVVEGWVWYWQLKLPLLLLMGIKWSGLRVVLAANRGRLPPLPHHSSS